MKIQKRQYTGVPLLRFMTMTNATKCNMKYITERHTQFLQQFPSSNPNLCNTSPPVFMQGIPGILMQLIFSMDSHWRIDIDSTPQQKPDTKRIHETKRDALARFKYIPENMMLISSNGTEKRAAVSILSNVADKKEPGKKNLFQNKSKVSFTVEKLSHFVQFIPSIIFVQTDTTLKQSPSKYI